MSRCPDFKKWEVQDNGDGTWNVSNGTDTFTMVDLEEAGRLVELLTGYEDRIYSAWESAMGEDL